ncbi:MAG: preprotein translocase subunit SecA [Oscillospiraceae bacterium]|jgi:preprotein translocase subunit SecA|nr:preprotein translocase subunit SecA [Oscillospiraceae bacterium]
MSFLNKLLGTNSNKEIRKLEPLADAVEALDAQYSALSDEELKSKTQEFKARLERGQTLDDILVEAFATVREASTRVLGLKPFRVQLICGVVLHQGRIAEMKTGEGKTLVAALPAYLNALAGNGLHIVTVNDYLAKIGHDEIGKIHRFLGLTVGLVVPGLTSAERRLAYAADITYGTNSEMGFDYLRDNMALYKQDMVQRGHIFAIIDEVDSILIDEARTPLIISGQADEATDLYVKTDKLVKGLKRELIKEVDDKEEEAPDTDADYIVDEKARTATLTAKGIAKAERYFAIDDLSNEEHSAIRHHIHQSIRAHGVMRRDVDYVVQDDEIIIVDEFTGRLMYGRRYSEGLHQAIEAKEGVDVAAENKTLATITYQNYFRMFSKLSGMTGTALTEAEEFSAIYHLDIVDIPTNKPMIRVDNPDVVYKSEAGKTRAIVAQIKDCHEKGQPILVGTVSVEKSEQLSAFLKKEKIPHTVLNALHHAKEAEIVAQAGKFGAITIATNMAGRGTDIKLGGNAEFLARADLVKEGIPEEIIIEAVGHSETSDEAILEARRKYTELERQHQSAIDLEAAQVVAAGGLFVLGTERHESRRIDNQLRGRSGRQGDPGASRFFISLEDDIMRLFGSERVMGMMDALKVSEDEPIEQKILSNAIESAQKKVESRNFQTRKQVLEYDDVMNQQREIIYGQRRKVLDGEDLKSYIRGMLDDVAKSEITKDNDKFDYELDEEREKSVASYEERYDAKEAEITAAHADMREIERVVLLRVVDEYWMEHIDSMHELRRGIGLRGYGNTKPIDAYKQEGFEMFEAMVNGIKDEVIRRLLTVTIRREEDMQRKSAARNMQAQAVGSDTAAKHIKKDKPNAFKKNKRIK